MTTRITLNDVEDGTVTVSGDDHMTYIAFASELRWPPGYAPERISTDLANTLDFVRVLPHEDSCDSGVFEYCQTAGCVRLFVYAT